MFFIIVVIINKAFKLFKLVLVVYCDSCCHWWYPENSGNQKTVYNAKNRLRHFSCVYTTVKGLCCKKVWCRSTQRSFNKTIRKNVSPNHDQTNSLRISIAQSVECLPGLILWGSGSMIDPGFKFYQCLLAGKWKRTACWLPRDRQVLHQRWILGNI